VKRVLFLVLALAAFAALAGGVSQPQASAAGIEVRSQNTTNRFPDGVQFTIFVGAEANITSARVRATIFDRPITSVRGTCTAGTNSNCTATLGNSQQSYIVPGAEISYVWEIEDANGNKLETPPQVHVYQDDRFQWQNVSEDGITVYYHFGSDESPRSVMRTAKETIDRIGALEQASVGFPIKIWLYQTATEMQPAVASRAGRGPNSSIRTLGEVAAADTALVSRDTDMLNIVRHEVAHIVTGQATKSHINFPSWINEGISVYSQKDTLPDEKQAMDLAVRRNAVLPLPSLSTFQDGADTVSLFYAEAGAVIHYIVETYGDAKFADWIRALRTDTVDSATKTVYGVDLLGIENGWRKTLGLPEVAAGTSGSGSTSNPASIPTLAPLGSNPPPAAGTTPAAASTRPAGNPSSNQASESEDGGSSNLLPIGLGVAVLLIIVGGAGYFLLMKKKAKPAV
jgi:hypothetical protein